jgi:hypothetical protein
VEYHQAPAPSVPNAGLIVTKYTLGNCEADTHMITKDILCEVFGAGVAALYDNWSTPYRDCCIPFDDRSCAVDNGGN